MAYTKQQILRDAEALVQHQQGGEPSGHDDGHVARVVAMARHLARETIEPVDMFRLELVCRLHDVDDHKITKGANHVTVDTFLSAHEVASELQALVRDILDSMSFTASKAGRQETTIEGKIAQDADRLDAIGAIGIARAFAYGGHKSRPLITWGSTGADTRSHFDDKLFKLEGLMNTVAGKRIANERTSFMRQFIARFDEETKR